MKKLPQLRDAAVLCRLVAADHGAHGDQLGDAQPSGARGATAKRWKRSGRRRDARSSPGLLQQATELYRGLRSSPEARLDRATLVAFYRLAGTR